MTLGLSTWLIVAGVICVAGFLFVVQLKRCPSNRLLLIRNRLARMTGRNPDVHTYHGGVYFVWPLLQEYRFLDLSPMKISVDLSECAEEEVRDPSRYYFKACLDVDSDEGRRDVGRHFWNRNREQIQKELKQRIKEVLDDVMKGEEERSSVNEERNAFLVELEQILNRELEEYGFRLLTISHKS